MEPFKVTILGCGSATPTPHHFCASQVVSLRGHSYMVDCGEGTQYQMRRYHIGFQTLGHVFISHLHGDHWFGLIGMISSFALLGRTAQLNIYAPKQLESTLNHLLQNYASQLPFQVIFHVVDTSRYELLHQDRQLQVFSIPLEHSVPTCGFLFRELQREPHLDARAIETYSIPVWARGKIKAGADWQTEDGETIPNSRLTLPPSRARSFAYCSDTAYKPDIAPLLHDVDVLYHEATYTDDKLTSANMYKHSTARQAASIASAAGVRRLFIGHFSQRYDNEEVLLNEAKEVFEETFLAKEGLVIEI